jgi:hypothetical protein
LGAVHVTVLLPEIVTLPEVRYTVVSRSSRLLLSRRSPDRRNRIEGEGGSVAQLAGATLSLGSASEQFTRRPPEPLAVIGPSLTMLPPWKVTLPFVDSPEVPQSMYQFPAGTTVAPVGEQLRPLVVHRVNEPGGCGAPAPPQSATMALIWAGPVPGHPLAGSQLYFQTMPLVPTRADDAIGVGLSTPLL